MATSDDDEIDVEEELDDAPFVEFDISVSPSDPSLELLSNKIANRDIIVPYYQRKFVWKIEQASRLIESFLMGLPVPQVFLYVNDDDQLEIIDGQQRIMSVKYFFEGYFGEPDEMGRRKVFQLKGLSERSEYNGRTFNQLPIRDQRRLRNSTLRAIHIKQLKPSSRSDSVFHIFERLNTGGTHLRPQEIRNAVYRGEIVSRLSALNQDKNWRGILGSNKIDRHQKDVELILRIFSLFGNWQNYEKPMLSYLNTQMASNRDFNSDRATMFLKRFPAVVDFINSKIVKPFRPHGIINSAILEAVILNLLEDESLCSENFVGNYYNLLQNEKFKSYIKGATTDTLVVKERIKLTGSILRNAS
jgi:hypothetical protein